MFSAVDEVWGVNFYLVKDFNLEFLRITEMEAFKNLKDRKTLFRKKIVPGTIVYNPLVDYQLTTVIDALCNYP